jgi:hypothetical protein
MLYFDYDLLFAQALQALSAEGDLLSPVKSGAGRASSQQAPSSALGLPFNLTAALTPTLTYTEFALICGSALLSAEDCRPILRLHRCLEQLVATAHITWAVSTVHVLGGRLKHQYLQELGFTANSAADKGKASGRGEKGRKSPFKVNWVSKWIDLDGTVEDEGISAPIGGQKEHVMIPGGMCNSLRAFLHKVTQHGTICMVSIDAMQNYAATVPSTASRTFSVEGTAGARAPASGKPTVAAAIRDEFSDILGEVQEVPDEDEDELGEANAFFEPDGLLATLAGVEKTGGNPAVAVILSHLATRLLTLVSVAYVHHVSVSALTAVRPAAASAGAVVQYNVSAEALEEAALQSVFDLSVLALLGRQWRLQDWRSAQTAPRSASGVVGITAGIARWKAHLDPITAELVMPLVTAATLSHMQGLALLVPHCSSIAAGAANLAPRALPAASTSAKTSEQLLSGVFPTAARTATRFGLLPLAVSTAPVPAAAHTRAASSPAPAAAQGNGATRHSASSSNLSGDSTAAAAGAAVTANTSGKSKSGVMNWW